MAWNSEWPTPHYERVDRLAIFRIAVERLKARVQQLADIEGHGSDKKRKEKPVRLRERVFVILLSPKIFISRY